MDIEKLKNTIHLADCIGPQGMCIIPDKSIDMILCDLPYQKTKNSWDTIIPFEILWSHYKRIIKDNGAIILFGQDKFSAKLMLSNEKMHRYNLIWKKGNRSTGFLNAKKMPLRNHEDILVFYKKTPTYNPQFWEGEPLHGMGKKFKEKKCMNNNYGDFDSTKNPSASRAGDTKKYPISILEFPKPHPPIHPTEKPIELCRYLVRMFSNKGDILLDNCFGSGSTLVSCILEERNYIGFEREPKYFYMGKDRIEKYTVNKISA